MTNVITIITLLCVIAGIWEFKYSSLPVWIFLSIGVLFGAVIIFSNFINYIMEKFKKGKIIVGALWIMPLIYSIAVTFLLRFQILTKKFIFELPSVGWALFFFSIYSLALSLRKSKEGFSLIVDKKWLERLENIEVPFKSTSLHALVIAIIIALVIAFICVCEMEYDFRMFFGCLPLIIISIIFGSCLKNEKRQFMVVFILLIVAAGNWIMVSYESYYNGVERRLRNEARVSYNSSVNILTSSLPEDRKYKEIYNVHKSSDAEICITKVSDGKEYDFYIKKSSPNRAEEYILSNFSNEFSLITYDRDVFKYDFSYYNRPLLDIGLARAISFSTFPDYIKAIMKNKFKIGDNLFLERRNYQRSTNFWVAFWLLYMFTLLVMYYKQTRDEVLKEKDKALKKLQEFDLMYHKTFDDFNKLSVIDSKQDLQRMNLRWSTIIEEVLADNRHGLKNKLTRTNLSELEQELYDKLFKDFQETILTHLRELPKVLDYHLTEESLEDIINNSKEGIPKNYYNIELSGLNFTEQSIINASEKDKKCNVNKHRVASIVHNLLTNAGQAITRKGFEKLQQGEIFQGKIVLLYSVKTINDKEYLSILVKDNAGGFPKNIIEKVYQEPVYSSDENNGEKRFGKGTMYVHYFAELMNANILVSNEIFESNDMGAVVEILIPIIDKCEKGERL